jgi:hypothetical protein
MSYHPWPAKIDHLTTKHPIGLIVNTLSTPDHERPFRSTDRNQAQRPLTARTRATTCRDTLQHQHHSPDHSLDNAATSV